MNCHRIKSHFNQWICSVLLPLALLPSISTSQSVKTTVGNGNRGFSGDGASPLSAQMSGPSSIWRANDGSLYIADTGNHRIRHINKSREKITTIAGTGNTLYNGNGVATSRNLNTPTSVISDVNGNIYITDTGNHIVRRIDASGNMSTAAGNGTRGFSGDGGAATSAQLNSPTGLYIRGDKIYISDSGNHRIRRIDGSGIITTIAGLDTTDGLFIDNVKATKATLRMPKGIFVDSNHNVYIADSENHRIRFLNHDDGKLTTFAGIGVPGFSGDGGLPIDAHLSYPSHVFLDVGSGVYIADRFNQRIRYIIPNQHILTLSGDGTANFRGENAPANRAHWKNPSGLFQYGDTLFVVDQGNNRIRTIVPDGTQGPTSTRKIEPGGEAQLFSIAFTGDGKTIINGMRFTASDLQTETGFEQSDVNFFRLYENENNTLVNASQIGHLNSSEFQPGNEAFIPVSTVNLTKENETKYYIASVVFSDTATQNHAMRISAPIGALSTNVGGYGEAIIADDAKAIYVDVSPIELKFEQQPIGGLSGHLLNQQPTVYAIDRNGLIDNNFADTVTVFTSGSGTLFGQTKIAKNGIVTFTSLRYDTEIDDEKTYLIARNIADNKYDALESKPSDLFSTNVSNNSPVIQIESSYYFVEDDPVGITLPLERTIFDQDKDELDIKYISNKTEIVLDQTSITIRPLPNRYGLDTLTITAKDKLGLETSKSISIYIKPVNDYPTFSQIDTLRINEDDTLTVSIKSLITDTDNTISELEIYFLTSNGLYTTIDNDKQTIKLWSDKNRNGSFILETKAMDQGRVFQSKQYTVRIEPQNDPPDLIMDKLSILQGRATKIDLAEQTVDIDSVPPDLFWTATDDSVISIEINSAGKTTLTPRPDFHGQRVLTFTAHNKDESSTTATLELEVKRVNSAPVLSLPDTIRLSSEETLNIDLAYWVQDKDDFIESLNWSIRNSELPGVILNKNILTWTPPPNTTSDSYILKVFVEDPHQGKDSKTVIVKLGATDPLLDPLPTIEFPYGEKFVLQLAPFVSSDTDTIILGPSESIMTTLNPSRTLIFIQANDGFKDTAVLNITAKSHSGRQIKKSTTVAVTNPVPEINTFPEIFLRAGETFKLSLDHFAVDDEPVDYLRWGALPTSGLQVSIHQMLNTATISANNSSNGTQEIQFIATDKQGASTKQTLYIRIHSTINLNEPNAARKLDTKLDIIDKRFNENQDIKTINRKNIEIRPIPDITLSGLEEIKFDLNQYIESTHSNENLSWRAQIIPSQYFNLKIDSSQILSISANSFPTDGTLYLQASDHYGIATTNTTPIRRHSAIQKEACDFNNDGLTNLSDFFIFADAFGKTLIDSDWNPNMDLVANGKIDFDDFFLFAESFNGWNSVIK